MKKLILLVAITLAVTLVISGCGKDITTTVLTSTQPVSTTTVTTSTVPSSTATTSAIPLLPVTTGVVTSITVTGATLSGSFGGQSAEERGFDWGTISGKYEYSWAESGSFQPGSFNRSITGLEEGKTYFFRCKARNGAGWGYGGEQSFRTLAKANISAVTPNTAKQGDNFIVTLTGSAFDGVTAVSFGDNVTVNKFTLSGDTILSANITIADGAAGVTRTVSVTTPAGTATLANAFTVERVLRTAVWTDTDFNWLSQLLTGQVQYPYTVHLQSGNKMYVTSVMNFSFGIEVKNGKLCFTGVTTRAWDNVYYKAYPNLKYDSAKLTIITDALPAEALQKLFNPPVGILPLIESMTTSDGTITINYYYP
jgi:hypothetical protein